MSGMKSDHNYAEMLNIMREQGRKDNPTTLQIGVMQSSNSVKVDDLVLNAEDLYVSDMYKDTLVKGDLVVIQRLNTNKYIILTKVVEMR